MSKTYEESRQAFSFIYANNLWEYGSGLGSLPENTLEYRYFLESFIAKHGIKTIVDFGCGDWNSSRHIYWWGAKYTGYDTVSSLIETNNKLFATDSIKFLSSPKSFSGIRSADLLIVKDVLQHWDSETIQEFLESIKGKFTYALITNSQYPAEDINKEIRVGQFRPVNLLVPPFSVQAELVLSYTIDCTSPRGEFLSDLKHVLLLKDW